MENKQYNNLINKIIIYIECFASCTIIQLNVNDSDHWQAIVSSEIEALRISHLFRKSALVEIAFIEYETNYIVSIIRNNKVQLDNELDRIINSAFLNSWEATKGNHMIYNSNPLDKIFSNTFNQQNGKALIESFILDIGGTLPLWVDSGNESVAKSRFQDFHFIFKVTTLKDNSTRIDVETDRKIRLSFKSIISKTNPSTVNWIPYNTPVSEETLEGV